MTGLFTPPLRSGLYDLADRADLAARLRRAGWQVARIDLADPRRVVADLGEALGFPAYYGKNLDALNDCLGDLVQPTALVATLPPVLDGYGRALWDLLTEHSTVRRVAGEGCSVRDGAVPFAVVRLSTGERLGSST